MEVTSTTGGGDYKIHGGITKLWVPFMGGSQINFWDGIKIGVFFLVIKKFWAYAVFLLIFT